MWVVAREAFTEQEKIELFRFSFLSFFFFPPPNFLELAFWVIKKLKSCRETVRPSSEPYSTSRLYLSLSSLCECVVGLSLKLSFYTVSVSMSVSDSMSLCLVLSIPFFFFFVSFFFFIHLLAGQCNQSSILLSSQIQWIPNYVNTPTCFIYYYLIFFLNNTRSFKFFSVNSRSFKIVKK